MNARNYPLRAFTDGTLAGGCAFVMLAGHAAAPLNAGLCDVALVAHGDSGASPAGARAGSRPRFPPTIALPVGAPPCWCR